jgi:DNA repair ATPase RecN
MADKLSFDEESIQEKIKELVKKMQLLDRAQADYHKTVASLIAKREELRKEISGLEKNKADLEDEAKHITNSARVRADALVQERAADAQKKADAIVDVANEIRVDADRKMQEASKMLGDAISKAQAVAKERKDLEADKTALSAERERVEKLAAKVSDDRKALTKEKRLFTEEKKKEVARLKDIEEAVSFGRTELAKEKKELETSAREVQQERQEVSILRSDLTVLESRLDTKRKEVASIEAREAAVVKREIEAEKKLAKAEFDLGLADKKEQDAAILNLQAQRAHEEIRKKEAVLAKLNIPIK